MGVRTVGDAIYASSAIERADKTVKVVVVCLYELKRFGETV